jgi:hypothetical protein
VKVAKADIYRQVSSLPALKFEEQQLTSFAGLVVFQKLFETCRLKERLHEACAHLQARHYYGFSTILQCLIVHIVLGYRQLRSERLLSGRSVGKAGAGVEVASQCGDGEPDALGV